MLLQALDSACCWNVQHALKQAEEDIGLQLPTASLAAVDTESGSKHVLACHQLVDGQTQNLYSLA